MPLRFNGQRAGENVRLISYQHPAVLLPRLLLAGLFLLVSVAGLAFLNTGGFLSFLLILGPILSLSYLLMAFYCWRRTLILVSNERVAYFSQKGVFRREFYECPVNAIVQVSHKIEGIVQTLCGFGTVIINTGDAASSVTITGMPDPFDIQQEIQNVVNAPYPAQG